MGGAKKTPDWERIEADYRAGVLSLREIAAANGITEGAIRKRAKRDGWTRDLGAKIRATLPPRADPMERAGFVYVIYLDAPGERFYKIGLAASFTARFEAHQCSSPYAVCVACAYFVPDMRSEERALHQRFAASRHRCEWFALSDSDLLEISGRSLLV